MKDAAALPLDGAARFNMKLLGFNIHRVIFPLCICVILLFVLVALAAPESLAAVMDSGKGWILRNADWYFMLMGNLVLLFCIALALSPFGKIRLGGEDARPEYGTFSWTAMLFATGMGGGMVFWGVSEPVVYYTAFWDQTPLNVAANTPEALHAAMGATVFHWGLHPWAIYITSALIIGYFGFNKKMPMTYSSGFKPLLGKAHQGLPGHLLDAYVVVLTIFGLATGLGFASLQTTSGLSRALGIENLNPFLWQLGFILAVTVAAAFSLWRGMHRGIKMLSNLNVVMAMVLLVLAIIGMGAWEFVSGVFATGADYVRHFLPLSQWAGREDADWFHGWTVFYWAWWGSWGPLVGMFVARISRGRSLRQLVFMALVAPTIACMLWFTGFGLGAIQQIIAGVGSLGSAGLEDVTTGIFQFFEALPVYLLALPLVIALLVIFMVTSADSGALVVDSLASGHADRSSRGQRIVWLLLIVAVAITLLFVGGSSALGAIQTSIVVMAFPFMLLTLLLMISVLKDLIQSRRRAG